MSFKKFKEVKDGDFLFTIEPGTAKVVERTVKKIEGYNHAGNPNYVKITIYQNIQKTHELKESKIIELASELKLEGNIDTVLIAAPANSTMIHLPGLFPKPWATTRSQLEGWLSTGKPN